MTTTATVTAIARQPARHPSVSITHWSAGKRTTAPTPTPPKAIPMARPRLRTNQLGRNIEWPV